MNGSCTTRPRRATRVNYPEHTYVGWCSCRGKRGLGILIAPKRRTLRNENSRTTGGILPSGAAPMAGSVCLGSSTLGSLWSCDGARIDSWCTGLCRQHRQHPRSRYLRSGGSPTELSAVARSGSGRACPMLRLHACRTQHDGGGRQPRPELQVPDRLVPRDASTYPRDSLALFAPVEAPRPADDVRIVPVRQEQLKDNLGGRYRALDAPARGMGRRPPRSRRVRAGGGVGLAAVLAARPAPLLP